MMPMISSTSTVIIAMVINLLVAILGYVSRAHHIVAGRRRLTYAPYLSASLRFDRRILHSAADSGACSQ